MRLIPRTACIATLVSLLAGPLAAEVTASPPPAAPEPKAETSFRVNDDYTAQRRPRVTVLEFDDTNKHAKESIYSSSVDAMLVTFLKRKSQFVVVERQKLGSLLREKKRLQAGMVAIRGGDKASRALLEKIDVFVFGSITLLENAQIQKGPVQTSTQDIQDALVPGAAEGESAKSRAERIAELPGDRIEIDAKLISRFDGRIIAAVQRSGPVACLRSIVERLGVALEQEYLRPHYGKLTVNLSNPEYIRVHLTPILPEGAWDEEKPPVELSSTVTIDTDYDRVEPWTMDPTTYTITNLLSGWYSMRLERPGYEFDGEVIENSRWEVRKVLGQDVVYDRVTNLPLDKTDRSVRRFVVRVDPLRTEIVRADSLGFSFRRQGGSISPLAKRQYMDDGFSHAPRRVILMGGEKITLNDIDRPDEYADDPRCDLFDERKPLLANYGRTYIGVGQSFNLDSFTGGELIIDDYQGEVVPIGTYRMAIWEPSYQVEKADVRVHDKDRQKQVKVTLTREASGLELETTGTRPASRVTLEGQETHYRIGLPLDFPKPKELQGVPVDAYTATTDIPGLTGWAHTVAIPASHIVPPAYDTNSKPNKPELIEKDNLEAKGIPYAGVKTRFGLAGRLEALSRIPDPLAADMFIDQKVKTLLDLLLYGVAVRPGDTPEPDYRQAALEVGRVLDTGIAGPHTWWLSSLFSRNRTQQPAPSQTRQATAQDANQPPGASAPPKPDPIPLDPDVLRRLLAQHLAMIDLLVLDPIDMAQLRRTPEVAGIIARYVADGGSLFAFAAAPGDYQDVIGAPFAIDEASRPTKLFEISPGLPGILHAMAKKRPKVKTKRPLPEVASLASGWHVIAYTKPGKQPRIIERYPQGHSGSVTLWLDDPDSFRGHWFGGTRPEVEQIRSGVEDHVMKKARELMRSRFDATVKQATRSTPSPAH